MFRRLGITMAVAALGLVAGATTAATAADAATTGAGSTTTAGAGSTTAAPSTDPVVAGLTITPSTVALGGSVTIVATATNTTGSGIVGASLGIENPGLLPITGLTHSSECLARNLTHLVYCFIGGIPAGGTTTLTLTVTPTRTGTFAITMYAGQNSPSIREYLNGTITVS